MNIPPSPQEQRPDEGVGHPAEVFWASEGAGAFWPLNAAGQIEPLGAGLFAPLGQLFRWRGIGSNGPRVAELKGWACGVDTSPRRTGFSSIYRTQLENFSLSIIWLSLKLRIHTSSLLFRRKEKPPLMNCIAFSSETSGAGVINACRWSGMMTNACRRNFPWLR